MDLRVPDLPADNQAVTTAQLANVATKLNLKLAASCVAKAGERPLSSFQSIPADPALDWSWGFRFDSQR